MKISNIICLFVHFRSDVSLAPDSFLIDQAKATMMQIVNLNMYKQMDHWYIYIYIYLFLVSKSWQEMGQKGQDWSDILEFEMSGKELEKLLNPLWSTINSTTATQTTAQANL